MQEGCTGQAGKHRLQLQGRAGQARAQGPLAKSTSTRPQTYVLTCGGLVAGEGDVELAVVRQVEGAADGLGELAVAIGARLHLQVAVE